jgi:uncharacterized protein YjaG (DUF416 family)
MLFHKVMQFRIFLIIRECDTADIGLVNDLGNQSTSAKFIVIGMGTR